MSGALNVAGGNVLVFGAAGGIGSAVARRLSADGYGVTLADLDPSRLHAIAAELDVDPARCVRCDISAEADVVEAVEAAEAIAPLYGMVCCAGGLRNDVHPSPGIVDVEADDWDWTHNLNARGAFLCLREYLRARRAAPLPAGRAVLIASVAGQTGGRSGVAYATAKAAVVGLARMGAAEWARRGVTVNAIAPGPIDTPALAVRGDAFRQQVEQAIPVGRLGQPAEIAGAVAYLLSKDAAFVTGATLDVNGGVLFR